MSIKITNTTKVITLLKEIVIAIDFVSWVLILYYTHCRNKRRNQNDFFIL